MAFRLESISKDSILVRATRAARDDSAALRQIIVSRLGQRLADKEQQKTDWLCETMAGACLALGLSRWTTDRNGPEGAEALLKEARLWTERATATKRADWKIETTHAQWLRVAYLNEPPAPKNEDLRAHIADLKAYWDASAPTINAFRENTGGVTLTGEEMARSARLGKVGLALSGGGFRASFYHNGVLARLAEADVLRLVDVLSTVSGGSIVGAHYYLLLRNLLESEFGSDLQAICRTCKRLGETILRRGKKNAHARAL